MTSSHNTCTEGEVATQVTITTGQALQAAHALAVLWDRVGCKHQLITDRQLSVHSRRCMSGRDFTLGSVAGVAVTYVCVSHAIETPEICFKSVF